MAEQSKSLGLIVGVVVAVGVVFGIRAYMNKDQPAAEPTEAEAAAKKFGKDSNVGDGWLPFMPPDGTFQVRSPGTLQKAVQHVPAKGKEGKPSLVSVTNYTLAMPEQGGTFLVSVTDIPVSAPDMDPIQRAKEARDKALERTKGELVREKPFKMAGYDGIELAYNVKQENKTLKALQRIVAGRHRLYQVVAMHYDESKDAQKFVESFRMMMPSVADAFDPDGTNPKNPETNPHAPGGSGSNPHTTGAPSPAKAPNPH